MVIESNVEAIKKSKMMTRFLSEVIAYMGVSPSVTFTELQNEGRWIRLQINIDVTTYFISIPMLYSFLPVFQLLTFSS